MVEENELNYIDKLMSDVKGEGLSFSEFAGDVAIEFVWTRAALKNLWNLLEKKGYMTHEDKEELNANIASTFNISCCGVAGCKRRQRQRHLGLNARV